MGFAVEVVRVRRAVREADSDNMYKYRKYVVSIEARLRAPVCGKRMIIAQRRGSRMSILTLLCKDEGHFGKSIIPKAQYSTLTKIARGGRSSQAEAYHLKKQHIIVSALTYQRTPTCAVPNSNRSREFASLSSGADLGGAERPYKSCSCSARPKMRL